METVTNAVENMIGDAMPERFGLVLDEWTHGTEHYITVYGCFETAASSQYPLLSLAPVMDEPDDQLNAEDHIAVIKRFLPFFCHCLNLAVRVYFKPTANYA
ncbi:hypothetical protein PF003_g17322 [Phytophthora fragariae]|uniref:Uncharacterized protein n=1 Tax=Phytophthora fragariae TaxID=53985 RepID=A0A6A3F116_9STRA|nr:hypothetical protein PF003_g17322 [Phytophthora fragariae]KAE8939219.1 hypothetical protein PF009_g10942 [Phytophthora fragariae]